MKFWKMALAEMLVVALLVFSTNTNGISSYITWLWERDKLKFCPAGERKKKFPPSWLFYPLRNPKHFLGACMVPTLTYSNTKFMDFLEFFKFLKKWFVDHKYSIRLEGMKNGKFVLFNTLFIQFQTMHISEITVLWKI